jgi:hypothetical protein
MRDLLLEACYLDWGKISPAIFGSMFQSVMDPASRRNLGAHYTSETNILKLIKPLFLDSLYQEFENVKNSKPRLIEFHQKLSRLKFLDPACGCGNFLVVTYRELRLLELQVLRLLYGGGQGVLDIKTLVLVQIDQMYGIEYEEFPARIAEVAMWLIDHQMNMKISLEFGQYFARLPLSRAANILHANALQTPWEKLIPPAELSYILGNPPFIGKQLQTPQQKKEMSDLFSESKGSGILDYVAGWYLKAAMYIQGTKIVVGFVSTNSIVQGEQAPELWSILFNKYKIKIHFAHRTFKWSNEARGNAAVHCVIIGFANFDIPSKKLFEYEDIKGVAQERYVKNISPYLIEGKDIFVTARKSPLCQVSEMNKGSQPTDGGNFLFTEAEKDEFLAKEPNAQKYIYPFVSAHEHINGLKRYCLWLVDASPAELKKLPAVLERIENVKKIRLQSAKAATVKWAEKPTLFTENRQPDSDYILIPSHSSENRKYIPIGFMSKEVILNNSCFAVPKATPFHFGVLTSQMHMVWVKYICGRIKSDFRYSNTIVYNNFPWPENPTPKQIAAIEGAAEKVLAARAQFPDSSLADLYDPLTMPPALLKAHQTLDKAVDQAYRPLPFTTDTQRIEYLFELYEKYAANLFSQKKEKKRGRERKKHN